MKKQNGTKPNQTALARSGIHLLVPEKEPGKENPEQRMEAEKVLKYA